MRLTKGILLLTSTAALFMSSACFASFADIKDGPPRHTVDVAHIPDAVPQALPLSPTGNPDYYDVFGKRYYVLKTNKGYKAEGFASWYGTKFQGKRTSTGDAYDMFAMTAASPVLPIPSFARVTNLQNGKSIIVKVNDRGPFHEGRVMDLSYVAAKKLDMLGHGTAKVRVEAIDVGNTIQLASNNNPNIYLQVGSYRQVDNATKIAQQLKTALKKPVFVSPVLQADQTIYRVLIGPLTSEQQSQDIKTALLEHGLTDGYTIRKL